MKSRLNISEEVIIETVREVPLDRLVPTETLFIETEDSVYCFTVEKPTIVCGVLVGGIFAERPVKATLIGSPGERVSQVSGGSTLRVGHRMAVLTESARGITRYITSAIKGLVLARRVFLVTPCLE